MDAEPDKRKVSKIWYLAEVILRFRLYLIVTSAWPGSFPKLASFPNGR